jgi:hypothetical protein
MTDRQRRALAARLNGDFDDATGIDAFALAGATWPARA